MEDIELITFSELIDKLITINIKLYNLMDKITEYSDLQKLSEEIKSLKLDHHFLLETF